MNKILLNTGIQDFIINNLTADILSVSLKKSPFPQISSSELAQQIKGHQIVKNKVPSWYGKRNLIFPPSLNLEQTSSEITARYKAGLVSGNTLIDLTGGLGVDTFFLSSNFRQVYHCEQDEALSEMAKNNFNALGVQHVSAVCVNGLEFLKEFAGKPIDWIYADPSRRNQKKGKVIRLEDYEPNILQHLDSITGVSKNFLLKTSPMLDLREGTRQLTGIREIHLVAVNNEMRELLWWIQPGTQQPIRYVAVNLTENDTTPFVFTDQELLAADSDMGLPGKFLYEPNAALMKSGAFALIGDRFGLCKLHPNTHLYTSNQLIKFPGRRFIIESVQPYKPGKMGISKANISSRNFPESVARIRKRNNIADGGEIYLFFVRLADERLAVVFTSRA